jgi:hypothetical protein
MLLELALMSCAPSSSQQATSTRTILLPTPTAQKMVFDVAYKVITISGAFITYTNAQGGTEQQTKPLATLEQIKNVTDIFHKYVERGTAVCPASEIDQCAEYISTEDRIAYETVWIWRKQFRTTRGQILSVSAQATYASAVDIEISCVISIDGGRN